MSQSVESVTPSEEIGAAIASGTVLLATDFDGTIARLAEHPDDAHADERALAALTALAHLSGVHVAVVSGRPLSDLTRLIGHGLGFTLVGEHGNDTGVDHEADPRIDTLISSVGQIAEDLSGSYVEVKRNSVGFHWRRADGDPSAAVERMEALAQGVHDVRLLRGKMLLELSFGQRTKADAVLELSDNFDAVVYLGDDVTDEDVFEALAGEGITVKVGPEPTSARHRVGDIDAVVELLEAVVDQSESKASTSMTSPADSPVPNDTT